MKKLYLLTTLACTSVCLLANQHITRARRALHELDAQYTSIPCLLSDDTESLMRTQAALRSALHAMSQCITAGLAPAAVKDIEQLALQYSRVTPTFLSRLNQKQAVKEQHALDTITDRVTTQHQLPNETVIAIRLASTYLRALLTPALYGKGGTRTPDTHSSSAMTTAATCLIGAAAAGSAFAAYRAVSADHHDELATSEYALSSYPLAFDPTAQVVSLKEVGDAASRSDDDLCTLALPGEGHDITIARDPERVKRADLHLSDLIQRAQRMFQVLVDDEDKCPVVPEEWGLLVNAAGKPATLAQRHAQVVAWYYLLKDIHRRNDCPLPYYDDVMPGSDLYRDRAGQELQERHRLLIGQVQKMYDLFQKRIAPEVAAIQEMESDGGYSTIHDLDKDLLENTAAYQAALAELCRKKRCLSETIATGDLVTSFYTVQKMADLARDMNNLVMSMIGQVVTPEEDAV